VTSAPKIPVVFEAGANFIHKFLVVVLFVSVISIRALEFPVPRLTVAPVVWSKLRAVTVFVVVAVA